MQHDELNDGGTGRGASGQARVEQAMSEVVRQARHALASGEHEEGDLRAAVARAAGEAASCGLGPHALLAALDAALDAALNGGRDGSHSPGTNHRAVQPDEDLRATAAALLLRAHVGGADGESSPRPPDAA